MTSHQVVQHVPFASCVEEFRYGTSAKSASSGKPALRIPNVIGGKLNLDELKCVPVDDAEFERLRLCEGDVLFVRTNGNPDFVGRSAIFTRSAVLDYGYDPSEFIYASYLIRARLNQSLVLPGFLCHYLSSPEGRQAVRERCRTSAGQFNINTAGLGTIPLPLPPLREQTRIASILDKADAIRRKREEGIRLTEELLRSTFLEMFGDPATNPKGWELLPVSEIVAEMEGGKSLLADVAESETSEYRVLKVSAVTWADYRPHESKPVPPGYVPPASHIVRPGDLLFSRANTNELVGATVFVFETPPNHLLPDKLWRFVWRNDRPVDPHYIHALFMSSAIRRELGRRATGTSGSMKNISKAKLLTVRIPVPPIDLQRKFGKFAIEQHKAVNARRDGAISADILFSSLVSHAFRGEL